MRYGQTFPTFVLGCGVPAQLGDPVPAGHRRHCRDANPNFCPNPPGNALNASNGIQAVWW